MGFLSLRVLVMYLILISTHSFKHIVLSINISTPINFIFYSHCTWQGARLSTDRCPVEIRKDTRPVGILRSFEQASLKSFTWHLNYRSPVLEI